MDRLRTVPLGLALLAIAWVLAPRAFAQPGALDPSFGDGGVVLLDSADIHGITIQPDGHIVAVGTAPSTIHGT